jgi:hypothetical protein
MKQESMTSVEVKSSKQEQFMSSLHDLLITTAQKSGLFKKTRQPVTSLPCKGGYQVAHNQAINGQSRN